MLQQLDHPRVPRYRDYFTLDAATGGGLPQFAIVQSYIPGSSLQALLDSGQRFSTHQVRAIATQVLDILIYLHELSPPVLHRDLKPSNLIWGEDGVYLVDFGAVQAQAAVTGVTFTVVGTGGYAPLEQFWGRALPASDLYGLGATLIHLLTGVPPIDLVTNSTQIQFRDRLALEGLFANWLEAMTEVDLDRRYASARQALDALQTGEVARKKPAEVTRPRRTAIQLQRHRDRLQLLVPPPGTCAFHASFVTGAIRVVAWVLLAFVLACFTAPFAFVPSQAAWAFPAVLWIVYLRCLVLDFAKQTVAELDEVGLSTSAPFLPFLRHKREVPLGDLRGVFMRQNGTHPKLYDVYVRSRGANFALCHALSEDECAWVAHELQEWLRSR